MVPDGGDINMTKYVIYTTPTCPRCIALIRRVVALLGEGELLFDRSKKVAVPPEIDFTDPENKAELAEEMRARGHDFEIVDMSTGEALAHLRVNGVFTLSAPVFQSDGHFFTVERLFDGEKLRDDVVMGAL